jgi:hypothetical protein
MNLILKKVEVYEIHPHQFKSNIGVVGRVMNTKILQKIYFSFLTFIIPCQ